MKTSEYNLPTALRMSFVFILTASFLFAGCSDEYRTIVGMTSTNHDLEGTWIAIDQDGNKDQNNVLVLMGTSGYHRVESSENSSDNLYIEFLYHKISTSMLRVTVIQHRVNGANLPVSDQEDVYYQVDNETLLLFNQKFARANT